LVTNLSSADYTDLEGDFALKQEQFNILKLMCQVTTKMDMTLFAQKADQTPSDAMANVQALVQGGYVRKSGSGYGVTEKGKTAIKAFTQVADDKAFIFYTQVGNPTVFLAKSPADFYNIVGQISADSLDFHSTRGDFENWVRNVLAEAELAERIGCFRIAEIKGEELRKVLLKVFEEKFDLKNLL
jgi:predicted transcriptional regulator